MLAVFRRKLIVCESRDEEEVEEAEESVRAKQNMRNAANMYVWACLRFGRCTTREMGNDDEKYAYAYLRRAERIARDAFSRGSLYMLYVFLRIYVSQRRTEISDCISRFVCMGRVYVCTCSSVPDIFFFSNACVVAYYLPVFKSTRVYCASVDLCTYTGRICAAYLTSDYHLQLSRCIIVSPRSTYVHTHVVGGTRVCIARGVGMGWDGACAIVHFAINGNKNKNRKKKRWETFVTSNRRTKQDSNYTCRWRKEKIFLFAWKRTRDECVFTENKKQMIINIY